MKDNKELLEKVVIALLCENEQLKTELAEVNKSRYFWHEECRKAENQLKALQPEEGSDANPHIK
jgi:hypothetical protein